MKLISKVLGAVALVSASMGASAAPYTSLVVFGDSLLDPGNAAALTAQPGGTSFFPPSPFPYANRFTNGPTAAEVLADRLGAPTVLGWSGAPGGTNFAVGGALTGNGNYNALVNSPVGLSTQFPAVANTGIAQQIARFDPTGVNVDQTLFLLWGGANDFFLGFAQLQAGLSVDFNALVAQTVGNIASDINHLVALGARNILVPSLPDLGLTPFAQGVSPTFAAGASGLTLAYNSALTAVLQASDVALDPLGVNLIGFDTASFLQQTVAQPNGLFSEVRQSCLSGGAAALATHCAGYLFFDDVHPTDVAQALLGERFADAVGVSPVPEPETWVLMLLALVALGARRIRSIFPAGSRPRPGVTLTQA